jgi:hypothetical protein
MRRQFQLSEEDEFGLTGRNLIWETIVDNTTKWIIVSQYPIPEGYTTRTADAALRIPPSYPDDQIDMVYFSPSLELVNGRPIRALSLCNLDGKQYQQWSRHRKPGEWRPGIDNISTHFLQVDSWLEKELRE